MVEMPVGVVTINLSPSVVKAFWWKYRLSLPGSCDRRIIRCPVSGSTHSSGGSWVCARETTADESRTKRKNILNFMIGNNDRRMAYGTLNHPPGFYISILILN